MGYTCSVRHVALVIGEALVDVLDTGGGVVRRPGGSAANVAVALARLDRPTLLATCFAEDPDGALLVDHLHRERVELAGDPHLASRTSVAVATVGADGAATYRFDVDWRLAPVTLPGGTAPRVVHACSYSAVLAPGASGVLSALQRLRGTATVSYDVNLRPGITGAGPEVRRGVEGVAAASDLVKASDEDLAVLYPGQSSLEAARHLLALGPTAVLLTRGAAGALALTVDGVVESSAVPVGVVDTIGAGDTFAAAVVDALWERGRLGGRPGHVDTRTWGEVLDHAARAAAVTVSRAGADPPRRHELTGS